MRSSRTGRYLDCAKIEDAEGYKCVDDDAFDTPQRPQHTTSPSTTPPPKKKSKGKAPSDSESEEDDEKVSVTKSDKKKIDFFDKLMPKMLALAGVPTIHVSRGDKTCTICKKTYTRTSMLRAHVQKTHLGEGKHKCDKCDKTFIEKAMLDAHHAKEHEGKGKECKTCHKKFMTNKTLANHEELHLHPGKDFVCPHQGCGTKFRLERYRDEHEQHCRFNDDRLEFPCQHCTRTFFQRKQLTRHNKKEHKNLLKL